MDIVFRVDASLDIGSGHVIRCLTLAEQLSVRGARCVFICRAHSGALPSLIQARGFEVTLLAALPKSTRGLNSSLGYAEWLGTSQQQDFADTDRALSELGLNPDWILVDHYGLDATWHDLALQHDCKLLVIDDLCNRRYSAHLLVDQNLSLGQEDRYLEKLPPDAVPLLGPRYALLGEEYRQQRAQLLEGRDFSKVSRVFVFFGGVDAGDYCSRTVQALADSQFSNAAVDVAVGQFFPHMARLVDACEQHGNARIHQGLPNLAELIASADFGIGAGGGNTWERMCLGLPSWVIPVANNQKPAVNALAEQQYIFRMPEDLALSVQNMIEHLDGLTRNPSQWMQMSSASMSMVDGFGAQRVAETICPSSPEALSLVPARIEHMGLFFEWANEAVTRRNAISQGRIAWPDHERWYRKRLECPNTLVFVLYVNTLPMGQIRFDLDGIRAVLSYSVDVAFRGRGFGKRLIQLGIQALSTRDSSFEIIAIVRESNTASKKIFQAEGFERSESSDDPELLEYRYKLTPSLGL